MTPLPWEPAELPRNLPRIQQSTPVVGYRYFELRGDLLYSLIVDRCWDGPSAWNVEPPVLDWTGDLATRPVRSWAEPATAHTTPGFFAVKSRQILYFQQWHLSHYVAAEVECRGLVYEHEYGYRSQGQVIRKLWLRLAAHPEVVRSLEQRYQCDVLLIEASPVILANGRVI